MPQVLLLCLILSLRADRFDESELIVIGLFGAALGFDSFAGIRGWKGAVLEYLKHKLPKKEEPGAR